MKAKKRTRTKPLPPLYAVDTKEVARLMNEPYGAGLSDIERQVLALYEELGTHKGVSNSLGVSKDRVQSVLRKVRRVSDIIHARRARFRDAGL